MTRSTHSSEAHTTVIKSSRDGHSLVVKDTYMEHGSDVLAKNGSLLPENRIISWAEVSQEGIKQ